MNKNEILRIAANEFAEKTHKLSSPLEIAINSRKCPGQSVDCSVPGCGQPPHLRVHSDFKYQEKIFFKSPIDVLWTSFERSRLLERKDELGIAESRRYSILEDIKIKCVLCSKIFLFTASEQKWYKKQGFDPPKRCPDCIEKERIKGLRSGS